MFTPRGAKSRAKSSPFTPSRSSRSSRQGGLFQTPTRQTRQSLARTPGGNRSLQTSQIWEETPLHRVERYGLALPVLITEALTSADRSSEISVSLDPSGWIWLVKGRKLYIWQFQLTGSGKCGPCRQLTLPPSDLAHSAQRVCLVPSSSDTQLAACLAVSPEGVVRYWPNVAYEDSTLEISAELKGEECSTVINFQPYGCLLATTTSSLVLVSLTPGHNRPTCRTLKSTQGMFSGIGRRMSSFIFGSSPLQTAGAPLQAIVSKPVERDSRTFYVLSGTHLQKWSLSSSAGVEKLDFQVDADRLVREVMARKIWEQDSIQLPQLQMWLLDMQPISVGVMILCAGVNTEASQTVYYAVATLSADEPEPPTHLGTFSILEHTDRYVEDDDETGFLDLKLLVPSPTSQVAFVYSSRTVHIVPVLSPVRGGPGNDKVVLTPEDNHILGAGTCTGSALFFSSINGLFSVSSSFAEEDDRGMDESVTELLTRDLTSLAASMPHVAEMRMSDDKSSQLKAAFLCSLKGDVTEAQAIIKEAFPESGGMTSSEMDQAVATVSRDLIDDYPTADPRWAESVHQEAAGSSNSVIIIQQLRDKQKAHDYLVTFLKRHGLWDRLSLVTVRDVPMSTRLLLCEHTEKLEAAIALREIQSEHAGIVDSCIRRVMEAYRDSDVPEMLTVQDVFYREVSRIEEIVPALLDYETESLTSDLTPNERVTLISAINDILQAMVQSALGYRQTQASVFQAENPITPDPEYIPWTSCSSPQGIRTLLTKQFEVTLQAGLREVREGEVRGAVFQQLLGLADMVLDGLSSQLESLRRSQSQPATYSVLQQKYSQERQKLIAPFLEHGQYERAASLAEKYFDFQTLIRLCEATDNQDRLQRYLAQFADSGFANFLFNYYMKEGKRGKLLAVPGSHRAELRQFLESDNTRYLSWLHDISTGNYAQAHETLMELGKEEEEFLARKKTLLSLSKLAALASDDPSENVETAIEGINEELSLILHQEQVPEAVIEDIGLDPENMRVMTPEELIELYIGSRNPQASEYEFKKALDLLQYIDKADASSDYEKLQLHIWARALFRDDWSNIPTDDPLEAIKETIFFKTIDVAYTEGCSLQEFLPPLESLLSCSELGALAASPNLRFLLQAGYEHIERVMV